MYPLPEAIITLLAAFAPLFSDRVWCHAQVLMVGAILAPGKRTVTAVLRVMGLSQERHFSNYHRVLNRAVWNGLCGSRILLGLLLKLVPGEAEVVLGADETIERRWSKKLKGSGCYRDPVRSSKKHIIHCFGLKWASMALLVRLPFSSKVWSLPFLTALCEPEAKDEKTKGKKRKGEKKKKKKKKKTNQRKANRRKGPRTKARGGKNKGKKASRKKDTSPKRAHKTSVDWVRQMTKQVHRWLPDRLLVLVVDGGFAVVSLALECIDIHTMMVSRLRWDAQLYHPPPEEVEGKRGPKPKKGKRQRGLKIWAARGDTPFEKEEIQWYGGETKEMLLFSKTALWYTPGWDPVPIRYVITRDPQGKLRDEVFFCTDPEESASAVQIVEWIVMRFAMETTFQEARAHLGIETQRQWSDLAIQRTTPCLLALFSIVILLAMRLSQEDIIPVHATAWYSKKEPTFSDCILLVRKHIWQARFFVNSTQKAEMVQFPREILDLLCLLDLPLAA